MLISTYWDERFWPSCTGLRECTRSGYESAWRIHIRPAFGDCELDGLDVERVEQWLAGIPTRGAQRMWE